MTRSVDESADTRVATRENASLVAPLADAKNMLSSIPANITPQQLLWHAIDRGVAPEQLSILADLEERFAKRQAETAFNEALAHLQTDVKQIRRTKTANIVTKTGRKFAYTYAPVDELDRELKPIAAKYGLSWSWDVQPDAGGKILTIITTVYHELGHSRASRFIVPTQTDAGMSEQQKFGSATTYGQRRGLELALGVVTSEEEPDAGEADPTKITEDQVIIIDDLLRESGADKERTLMYAGAPTVEEIRAVDYDRVAKALRQRIEENEKRKARAAARGVAP